MSLSATGIKAVLFDLDGTLVDTAPDLGYAANCVRETQGLPPLPLEQYRPVASAGARGLLRVALGISPEHADFPARRDAFLNFYRDNIARASCLFPGMDEFLQALEKKNIRWGVATNKPAWLTELLLKALRLDSRCACSLSPNQGPGETIRPKPAPDMLLRACAQLELSVGDCIYVGDDERDIAAGRAAGMKTIAADWGYLGEGGPIQGWGADAIAAHPEDLSFLLFNPGKMRPIPGV